MAPFKLISGQYVNDNQQPIIQEPTRQLQNQPEDVSNAESFSNQAKRIGSGILGSVAQGAENIAQLPGKLLSGGIHAIGRQVTGNPQFDLANIRPEDKYGQTQPGAYGSPEFIKQQEGILQTPVKQNIAKALGYENLNPNTYFEDVVQGIAEDIPALLASPVGLASKLGTSLTSNVAAKGLKHLGYGPVLQMLGGLGAGASTRYLTKSGFGQLRKDAKSAMDSAFRTFDRISPTIQTNASQLENNINNLISQAEQKFSPKVSQDVSTNLNNLTKDIQSGVAPLSKIREAQERAGKILTETTNAAEKGIYKQVYGELTNFINNVAAENPSIAEVWPKAVGLYKGLNGTTKLRNAIESATSLKKIVDSPILSALIGGGTGAGTVGSLAIKGIGALPGVAKTAAGAAGTALTARTVARIIDFARNPETRKLYNEALQDAILGDKISLATNLKNLNSLAKEFEKRPEAKEDMPARKKRNLSQYGL